MTQICVVCTQKDLSWAVENPFSSLFLEDLLLTEAQAATRNTCTFTLACVELNARSSPRSPSGNGSSSGPAQRVYTGVGPQEDGTFSTALEVSYPRRLCKQVAHAARDACALQDFTMCPVDFQEAALLQHSGAGFQSHGNGRDNKVQPPKLHP